MSDKKEVREVITEAKLDFLASFGSEMDVSKEQAEKEENQAIGAIRGLIDSISVITQLVPIYKDNEEIKNFAEKTITKLTSLKERLNIAVIQKKSRKDALLDLVDRIEKKYKGLESLRDSKFVGINPKDKPKIERSKKGKKE